jgi:hypothetical protein
MNPRPVSHGHGDFVDLDAAKITRCGAAALRSASAGNPPRVEAVDSCSHRVDATAEPSRDHSSDLAARRGVDGPVAIQVSKRLRGDLLDIFEA